VRVKPFCIVVLLDFSQKIKHLCHIVFHFLCNNYYSAEQSSISKINVEKPGIGPIARVPYP
jgi:hypothetical protein